MEREKRSCGERFYINEPGGLPCSAVLPVLHLPIYNVLNINNKSEPISDWIKVRIILIWWSIGDSNPWPRQCECRALTKHAYIRPDAMIELTCFWDLISFGDASRKALWRDKKVNDDVVMPVNGNLFNHPRQNHLLGVVAGGIKFFGPVMDLMNL